jgi:hypothetical protein
MNFFESILAFGKKHIWGSHESDDYIPKDIMHELACTTTDCIDGQIEKDGWIYSAHNSCYHPHSQCEPVDYIEFSKRRK